MEPLLLWGFALMGAALLLFVVELFLPSGGVLGFISAALAVASVIVFWRAGTWWGIGSALFVLTSAPLAFNFAIKIMPNTPMGRRLILSPEPEEAERAAAEQVKSAERAIAIVGATGVAVTPLRPVGMATIEGQRIEVLAEGGPIDPGTPVRISSVVDNQVRVRPA
ncbi:MAG: NfeD family protein [Planctomycetes bacterium]|nr:NfeD family protein [Planctomycetota bacterium]